MIYIEGNRNIVNSFLRNIFCACEILSECILWLLFIIYLLKKKKILNIFIYVIYLRWLFAVNAYLSYIDLQIIF